MFIFEQIRTGGDRNFAYLVGDRESGEAVVVDPSYDPDAVLERATAQKLSVTHVVNTHGHTDHTNGNDRVKRRTGAKLVAHESAASRPEVPVAHGDVLRVGSLELRFLHTPGHTTDDLCIRFDPVVLTGDLLFVGKIGGTPDDRAAEIEYRSLHDVVLRLPDSITVWPGHDYGCRPSSTIGIEKRTNPFLLAPDLASFLALKRDWARYKEEHGLK
jgi:glyoxylase-like metal-dependent hydrolase (beta-lactamase superfamily II)